MVLVLWSKKGNDGPTGPRDRGAARIARLCTGRYSPFGRSERSSDARWIPNPTREMWTCSLFGGEWQSYFSLTMREVLHTYRCVRVVSCHASRETSSCSSTPSRTFQEPL